MKYYINITADYNDGDYISEMNEITQESLDFIRPVIKAIQEFDGGNNFPTGECYRSELGELSARELYVDSGLVSQEQFDAFRKLTPSSEFGIHTIESIHLYEVLKETQLL
jgi:hypothetical protein